MRWPCLVIILLLKLTAMAQDSSLKFIMPYETDRLFVEQISEYQAYYNNELAINKFARQELLQEIDVLKGQKQNRRTRNALYDLEEQMKLQDSMQAELNFYLDVWLEIEEFYDRRQTLEFISQHNKLACYRLYTLYDTLEVSNDDLVIEAEDRSYWMEYPEPTEAEYIEDVRVITPASTKWVKKRSERPCNSPYPNDCLVWCLVEVPGEYEVLSRKLNIITCPSSYIKSSDGQRCEKKVNFTGDMMFAETEKVLFAKDLKRYVEILDWELIECKEEE